jgi:hypothetical protein
MPYKLYPELSINARYLRNTGNNYSKFVAGVKINSPIV